MNKEHFLIELKIYLRPLPSKQQLLVLSNYESIFNERLASGESEEEIAKALGKPKAIAEGILSEFDMTIPEKKVNTNGWQKIHAEPSEDYPDNYYYLAPNQKTPFHFTFVRFFQFLGLLALNFLFVIWIIFSLFMILAAGWLVAISFILSPLLSCISLFISLNAVSLFQLFASILLFGIGILGLLFLIPLTRFSFRALRAYFQWNLYILRRER